MATYNGEKYLYQQVESILKQLTVEDELVISDDDSIDETLLILKSFKDERIKIHRNNKKKGPVGNFENAISEAKGRFIFLADQDDIWLAGKIDKHLSMHQTYDLVISDAIVVDENHRVIFESFFKERGSKAGLLKNIIKNSYLGCCMSFNRKIIDYALPFPNNIHMHDWWLGLVAEFKGSVCFSQDKLMYYVRHRNNVSPTLGKSEYSFLKRIRNRFILAFGLIFLK
jgi:glycosyltransferase involved in cell wall biosynthesis